MNLDYYFPYPPPLKNSKRLRPTGFELPESAGGQQSWWRPKAAGKSPERHVSVVARVHEWVWRDWKTLSTVGRVRAEQPYQPKRAIVFHHTEDARKRKKEHQSNEKTGITHTTCHAAENSAGVLFPEECLSINIDIEFHCQIINCS